MLRSTKVTSCVGMGNKAEIEVDAYRGKVFMEL